MYAEVVVLFEFAELKKIIGQGYGHMAAFVMFQRLLGFKI